MRIFLKYFYQITMTLIFIFIAENSYGALNGPTWETEIRPVADTSRTKSLGGGSVGNDAFQTPSGIAFSNDGKKVFATNKYVKNNQECLRTFNLSSAYDLRTAGKVLDEIDPIKHFLGISGDNNFVRCEDINFSNDGRKLFISNQEDEIFQFDLTAPFTLEGMTYNDIREDFGTGYDNFAFNNDGTKIFSLKNVGNSVKEYNLTSPYDITSRGSAINDYNLDNYARVDGDDFSHQGIEFSSDGTAMFIISTDQTNPKGSVEEKIIQFQLERI